MTVALNLSPEREAALQAHAQKHGMTVHDWLEQLVEQSVPLPSSEPLASNYRPIWEIIIDSMKDVPAEDVAALPKDGASQIDHYIYGQSRRDI